MTKNKLSVGIVLAFSSLAANANIYAPDGRTNAMGNAGVAVADYLSASLYNPALVAVFDDSDDVGILLPSLGVNIKDADSAIESLDDLQEAIDDFESFPSMRNQRKVDNLLDDLAGSKPVSVVAGAAFAIAIPSHNVSVSVFGRGFVDTIATFQISSDHNTRNRYKNSDVTLTSFGYGELGIALAKQHVISGELFSFGISPKYQMLQTNFDKMSVEDFDFEYTDENETYNNVGNVDLGGAWLKNDFRLAVSFQNLIAHEIRSKNGYLYELNPQTTLGLAYATEAFTFAVDVDLTEQERFVDVEDNTQFIRTGVELNAWNWVQVRFGYEHEMNDTLDSSVTAGLGFSPFGTLNVDVAGSYASEEQMGISASLSFTF